MQEGNCPHLIRPTAQCPAAWHFSAQVCDPAGAGEAEPQPWLSASRHRTCTSQFDMFVLKSWTSRSRSNCNVSSPQCQPYRVTHRAHRLALIAAPKDSEIVGPVSGVGSFPGAGWRRAAAATARRRPAVIPSNLSQNVNIPRNHVVVRIAACAYLELQNKWSFFNRKPPFFQGQFSIISAFSIEKSEKKQNDVGI